MGAPITQQPSSSKPLTTTQHNAWQQNNLVATIPSRIGSFEVIRQIGSGGMGSVYLAEHPLIGKKVALKVLEAAPRKQVSG